MRGERDRAGGAGWGDRGGVKGRGGDRTGGGSGDDRGPPALASGSAACSGPMAPLSAAAPGSSGLVGRRLGATRGSTFRLSSDGGPRDAASFEGVSATASYPPPFDALRSLTAPSPFAAIHEKGPGIG